MAQREVTRRADVLSKAIQQFEKFVQVVDRAANDKEMASTFGHILMENDESRSLREVALEDAMETFSFIMMDVPESELPYEFYKRMYTLRYPEERITNEDARKDLKARIDHAKEEVERTGEVEAMPLFLEYVYDDAPEQMRNSLRQAWMATLANMRTVSMNEGALAAQNNATLLIEGFNATIMTRVTQEAMANSNNGGRPPVVPSLPPLPGRPANSNGAGASAGLPGILNNLINNAGGENLSQKAAAHELAPVFGREEDTLALTQVLLQKENPFALLQSVEGIDRDAVVENLAQMLSEGKGPQRLKNAQVVRISLPQILIGGGGGDAASTFKRILREVNDHNETRTPKIILHFTDYGASTKALEQGMIVLRGILAIELKTRQSLMTIIDGNEEELFLVDKQDKSVLKPFQRLDVHPMTFDGTLRDLKQTADRLTPHHGVAASDEILDYIAKKTDRFMPNLQQPGKGREVLAVALAKAEAQGRDAINENDVETVIADKARLPLAFIGGDMSDRIENLGPNMKKEVFGQDSAVDRIASTVGLVNTNLNDPNKPLGVFYMTGPTGVGKTEIAKQLASALFNDPDALIRVNLGDFAEKHTVSRILGSPPGYVGYGEKTALEDVDKRPFSVVLFDEAEKAHPDINNALMTLLDEGRLDLLSGKKLNFRNCVIILTSNLGATAAENAREQASSGIGFQTGDDSSEEAGRKAQEEAIKAYLKPEFRNRVTMLHLSSLNEKVAEKIALKKVEGVSRRLRDNKAYEGLTIKLSDNALKEMIELGYDRKMGARPMERAIENYIKIPLGNWLKENKQSVLGKQFELVVKSVKESFEVERREKGGPKAPAPTPA